MIDATKALRPCCTFSRVLLRAGVATVLPLLPLLAACTDRKLTTEPLPVVTDLRVVEVATGLQDPLFLTAPVNDTRLFVVEQPGRIRIIKAGQLLPTPFLDITAKIASGGERGLLGLAFHPRYSTNGFFYVNYTDLNGNTQIERYHVSSVADVADRASALSLLSVVQPYPNHNGGMVAFGADGLLYIGMGDGGSAGDPQGNGQNKATLLGKLLRIDVDRTDAGKQYAIPASNPFVGQAGARGEIWALGLRNPWRFSFDREAGLLYIGDVGQGSWEEIDAVPAARAGVNYGWNPKEGTHCYTQQTCATAGLTDPIVEYGHSDGCSVTGGYVYRGTALGTLRGTYFYSDYCSGWLRSFRYAADAVTEQKTWTLGTTLGAVLSFGEGADGELYICTANGKIYRIVPASTPAP